jgi:hypothetical protein
LDSHGRRRFEKPIRLEADIGSIVERTDVSDIADLEAQIVALRGSQAAAERGALQ